MSRMSVGATPARNNRAKSVEVRFLWKTSARPLPRLMT